MELDVRHIERSNMVWVYTLLDLLVSKGIVTEEEFMQARISATAKVDQVIERVRQEKIKEHKDANDSIHGFLSKLRDSAK